MEKHKGYCSNCEELHIPPTGKKFKLSKSVWEDGVSDSEEEVVGHECEGQWCQRWFK